MLAAQPGFVHSPDAGHLRFDVAPIEEDPIKNGLAPGAPVGVLGIEPSTRRRNRMSGRVSTVDERGFTVAVVQSYGNCSAIYSVPRAPFPGIGRAAPCDHSRGPFEQSRSGAAGKTGHVLHRQGHAATGRSDQRSHSTLTANIRTVQPVGQTSAARDRPTHLETE
jgi:hypothetical protein